MTQQEHFNRSVAVLVKAYINDELQHGSCTACAVGNLIAAGADYKRTNGIIWSCAGQEDVDARDWFNAVRGEGMSPALIQKAQKLIAVTGYNLNEITRIEAAFEFRNVSDAVHEELLAKDQDELQHFGLMAVVDVLAEIHGIDLTTADAAKSLFVKEAV